jgi:hypothetical protein
VPHRTTLSRRYKRLYEVLEELVVYLAQVSQPLGEEVDIRHLYEDQSLFKAQGPVWHQSDRRQGRIPPKLYHLDTHATWAKSGYHGWVYGYGLHLTCNRFGFPALMQVETAAYAESSAVQHKEQRLPNRLKPLTFCGDDAYTQALRIRRWAQHEIILLTPALRWRTGRYAQAYRRFIQQPDMATLCYVPEKLRLNLFLILSASCLVLQVNKSNWQSSTSTMSVLVLAWRFFPFRLPTVFGLYPFATFPTSKRLLHDYAHPSVKSLLIIRTLSYQWEKRMLSVGESVQKYVRFSGQLHFVIEQVIFSSLAV